MRLADSITSDATMSSRFSDRVVEVIGSASASFSFGKSSGHSFSPVVREINAEPVTPGIMIIGVLPFCLATIGAGKMSGRFGLPDLRRQALVETTTSDRKTWNRRK